LEAADLHDDEPALAAGHRAARLDGRFEPLAACANALCKAIGPIVLSNLPSTQSKAL
jgi:hypothetical protein